MNEAEDEEAEHCKGEREKEKKRKFNHHYHSVRYAT